MTLDKAKSHIPVFPLDSERKKSYLSWRICGFNQLESITRANIAITELLQWRHYDTVFNQVESNLDDYRDELLRELITEASLKSARSLMEIDTQVIREALNNGIAGLDKQTYDYLKMIKAQADAVRNPVVRKILGMDKAELPGSWEEAVHIYRFRRDKQQEALQDGKTIIEADYQESPTIPNREEGAE